MYHIYVPNGSSMASLVIKQNPHLFIHLITELYMSLNLLRKSKPHLECLDKCEIQQRRIIDLYCANGLGEVESLQGLLDGERRQGLVGHHEGSPGEPYTVESHATNPLCYSIQCLLPEPLCKHRLKMRWPVHTSQLYPLALLVHNPPRARRERHRRYITHEEEQQKRKTKIKGIASTSHA